MVRHVQPGDGLAAALNPAAVWTVDQHLAAAQVDALNLLVWAKTKDAQRGRGKPEPVPRPWQHDTKQGRFTDIVAADTDTVRDLLARPRRPAIES